MTKIKNALISVYDKTGLIELVTVLHENGVNLFSTGGTFNAIKEAGFPVIGVSDYTRFPEMMDGRVKTLHPKIFGGILARRDHEADLQSLLDFDMVQFDLVVTNLYPFKDTVSAGGNYAECIEKIDIGGPSQIRAAAKNHQFVTVVPDVAFYSSLIEEIKENNGGTSFAFRQKMAMKTFGVMALYENEIFTWFKSQIES